MARAPQQLTPARARFLKGLAVVVAVILIASVVTGAWWTAVGMVCVLLSLGLQLRASRPAEPR